MNTRIRLHRGHSEGTGLMLTPLIDIMFLITIFFVLTSSYSQQPALEVNLPQASSGKPALTREITVVLEADGTIKVSGQAVTLDSLAGFLQQTAGGEKPPTVLLMGDQSIPYGLLIQVMDRIRLLGWDNLSLVTKKTREDP